MIPSIDLQFLIIFWWWLRHCSWERVPRNLLMILLRCHLRRCFFSPSITSRNFIKNQMYFLFSSSVQWEVEYCFLIGGLSSRLQMTFFGLNTQGLNLESSLSKEAGLEVSWEVSWASCWQLSLISGVQQYYQSGKYYQNLRHFKKLGSFWLLKTRSIMGITCGTRMWEFFLQKIGFQEVWNRNGLKVTTKVQAI